MIFIELNIFKYLFNNKTKVSVSCIFIHRTLSSKFQIEHDVLKGNEDLVHHLDLHQCNDSVNTSLAGKGWIIVPRGQPRPEGIEDWVKPSCYKSIVYAWSIGGKVCVHFDIHVLITN